MLWSDSKEVSQPCCSIRELLPGVDMVHPPTSAKAPQPPSLTPPSGMHTHLLPTSSPSYLRIGSSPYSLACIFNVFPVSAFVSQLKHV